MNWPLSLSLFQKSPYCKHDSTFLENVGNLVGNLIDESPIVTCSSISSSVTYSSAKIIIGKIKKKEFYEVACNILSIDGWWNESSDSLVDLEGFSIIFD